MAFSFFNPLMLIGLVGISLPILVHLLSRKKHDVVLWGAMQFLDVGRFAKRTLRLKELLLLLLRVGLIVVLTVALARPWAAGGLFSNLISTQNRDVVFVVDGSYSMGWQGGAQTPHAWANQWVHQYLETLGPGDQAALIDAREQPRRVVDAPTGDLRRFREALNRLPPPAGSVSWPSAIASALEVLTGSSRLKRDVIVLTDGQSYGWSSDDDALWTRVDELRKLAVIAPSVWVVEPPVGPGMQGVNASVGRLQVSRGLTVADLSVRVKTSVRLSGGEGPVSRRVYFEVDGQRLPEKTLQVELQPGGETSVEFSQRFGTAGSHVVSILVDADDLPGDDRADAVVSVTEAIPVLLVDGDPQPDPARSETFFAKAALSPASNESPWVRAGVVSWDRFDRQSLGDAKVVILANVPHLTDQQLAVIKAHCLDGGGLLVTLGDRVQKDDYNQTLFNVESGMLPVELESVAHNDFDQIAGVHIVNDSLELPWMARFRSESNGGLTQARFRNWWKIRIESPTGPARPTDGADPAANAERPNRVRPVTLARLDTSDPLLLSGTCGRGSVMLLAAPIDADWSTLPARPDFVALLHELIFQLGAGTAERNVDVGTPLVLPVEPGFPADAFAFYGPGGTSFPAQTAVDALYTVVVLNDTRLPGIYSLQPKPNQKPAVANRSPEPFVVNFDRRESNLSPLQAAQRARLQSQGRMSFVRSLAEVRQRSFAEGSATEFWRGMLLLFIVILTAELVLTRALVKGGHAAPGLGDIDDMSRDSLPEPVSVGAKT